MAIVEVSVSPIGKGVSVGKYVKMAVALFRKKGFKMFHSPMGTCIEGELDEIFSAIQEAHDLLAKTGVKRISTLIKIDDRRDKKATMKQKMRVF